ncbi:MAG TPA: Gfo/Idh/MocA family oxidoreductase [Thermoleophilaceae bacterium]
MAEAVRIAMVGAGRMGRVHLDALTRCRHAEAVAVVDPVPAARDAAGAAGLAGYATLDELLDAGGFDAVLVAAPSDRHRRIVTTLARAGLPVLCEKPCGTSADEAAETATAVEAAGTPLQIGYWRRFVPELAALRERISEGELGEITLVACHQWDRELPHPAFRASSGGITVDLGVHEYDQVRWLLGQEFETVAAVPAGSSDADAGPTDPDSAAVLARLSGGTAASITLGRHFGQEDSCWFEAFGRESYERIPFMWGDAGQEAFVTALTAQADAFAGLVRGEPLRGASAADAVAALETAGRVAEALERAPAEVG